VLTSETARRRAAFARVRRLLAAARVVASDASLVDPLVASTGLSRQGVLLGLGSYLELDAADADIEALVRTATPASCVHVILSANVFTAPLRALAVAWAASETLSVRPSRRDPVFARALVRAIDDARVTLVEKEDVSCRAEGEVHVYGRDETVDAVVRGVAHGVIVRGHGAGMGIALINSGVDEDGAAHAVAEDVVVFDQRGCLSPRVVIVEGGTRRAALVAERLHLALTRLGRDVPRGRLDEAERREAARYVETMAFVGRVLVDEGHVVGLAEATSPVVVPPSGRHVHIVAVDGCEDARLRLAPVAPFIVAIGGDDASKARALVADDARVRISKLGWMQRPPLDGPVDLRTRLDAP
jgi:hypothetical protein